MRTPRQETSTTPASSVYVSCCSKRCTLCFLAQRGHAWKRLTHAAPRQCRPFQPAGLDQIQAAFGEKKKGHLTTPGPDLGIIPFLQPISKDKKGSCLIVRLDAAMGNQPRGGGFSAHPTDPLWLPRVRNGSIPGDPSFPQKTTPLILASHRASQQPACSASEPQVFRSTHGWPSFPQILAPDVWSRSSGASRAEPNSVALLCECSSISRAISCCPELVGVRDSRVRARVLPPASKHASSVATSRRRRWLSSILIWRLQS